MIGRQDSNPNPCSKVALPRAAPRSSVRCVCRSPNHHYSALHESALNKSYVEDFRAAYGKRPNYHSVAGYDGMHLIYEALKKTQGNEDGDALVAAMKGMRWESPRG